MIRTAQNVDLFDKKPAYYVNHFWYIVSAILKEVLHVKQITMLRIFIIKFPSFIIPKNYGSLTLQAKFKVELNMGDLTCFFETVCTFNVNFRTLVFLVHYKLAFSASELLTYVHTYIVHKAGNWKFSYLWYLAGVKKYTVQRMSTEGP